MFERIGTILRQGFGRGAYPHQLSFLLEIPLRRLLTQPKAVADRLGLAEDARVIEVGCGSGFFSVDVARRTPRGHLELFDLQPEMLEKARRKVEAAGLENVGYTAGNAVSLPFEADSFDAAFMVTVLGEVPDGRACLRELRRVLRPGGLLSISEELLDPDFYRFSTLRRLVESEGFAFSRAFGPPWAYTANFHRT